MSTDQPDPLVDAFQTLYDLVQRYGWERTEQQHETWWQIENAMEELAEAGIAEGRRQGAEGLQLQREGYQWSIWSTTPGGLSVTVPSDDGGDQEGAARAFQAQFGGELRWRRRVTLVGEWELEQPDPLADDPVAHRLGLVDANGRTLCRCLAGAPDCTHRPTEQPEGA